MNELDLPAPAASGLLPDWPLYLALNGAAALLLMGVIWLWSLKRRDVSMVDAFWAPGFALMAWTSLLMAGVVSPLALLLAGLTSLWAIRLGTYLFSRWRAHAEEDRRYAAMRRKHGSAFARVSLMTVFALQGVLIWLISLPLQLTLLTAPAPELSWLAALGTLVFLLGFSLEAAADAQLRAFKSDPAKEGKVMDQGLWAWSRHPNYFGNAVLWWGLFIVAAEAEAARWAFFAPLLMTFLLLRVSGVSLLEKTIGKRRPAYAAYQRRVNAFVPLPPSWKKRHNDQEPCPGNGGDI